MVVPVKTSKTMVFRIPGSSAAARFSEPICPLAEVILPLAPFTSFTPSSSEQLWSKHLGVDSMRHWTLFASTSSMIFPNEQWQCVAKCRMVRVPLLTEYMWLSSITKILLAIVLQYLVKWQRNALRTPTSVVIEGQTHHFKIAKAQTMLNKEEDQTTVFPGWNSWTSWKLLVAIVGCSGSFFEVPLRYARICTGIPKNTCFFQKVIRLRRFITSFSNPLALWPTHQAHSAIRRRLAHNSFTIAVTNQGLSWADHRV